MGRDNRKRMKRSVDTRWRGAKELTGDGALGVTVSDVLQVFGGGVVIEEDKPLSCQFCNKKKGVLYTSGWRKGGKIIRRIRADGVHVWACHSCGREVKRSRDSVVTIH